MIRSHLSKLFSQLHLYSSPGQCQMCHNALEQNRQWVCHTCEHYLPYSQSACLTCAEPLPPIKDAQLCGRCLKHPPAIDAVRTCFDYQYPINLWLPQFKFSRRFALAHWFAHQFMQHATKESVSSPNGRPMLPPVLMPVPLHNQRLRERGYNQALLIAQVLSKQLQRPLDTHCVIRNKRTLAQSGLSLKERQRNIKQAFSVTCTPPKRVTLIDDVITTGSTINELAAKLKSAGTEYVEAWVIAHAPLS